MSVLRNNGFSGLFSIFNTGQTFLLKGNFYKGNTISRLKSCTILKAGIIGVTRSVIIVVCKTLLSIKCTFKAKFAALFVCI